MSNSTDTILTQIYMLLESMHARFETVNRQLAGVETEVNLLKTRINDIINLGFVDGDLHQHHLDHLKKGNFLKRLFKG